MHKEGKVGCLKNRATNHLILLLIVVVPLFTLGLSNHGLWSADEPRVAEIGREMALSGNWAVPTLNQKPFLEHPPLYYASLAVAFKAFGTVSDKVARIPSALFAFGGILVLFFMANRLFGPRAALLSGLILATTGEYFRVAHWVIVDGALTFFVMSSMGLFITGYLSANNRRKLLCYVLFYISCTLAFYAKGFVGIVIPGLSILVFLTAERNFRELLKMRLWLGFLIFVVMTLPWFIALWLQAGTEHLNVFLVHNHLQRFFPAGMAGRISGSASGHHHPFYYYITEFPSGFLPWSVLLIPALYLAFSKTGKSSTLSEKGHLFTKCWFFAGIIFFSIASTKRVLYLMPIFAPIAMLTALYIDYTIADGAGPKLLKRIGKVFMWVLDVSFLLIGIGLMPAYFYLKKAEPGLLSYSTTLLVSVTALSILVTASSIAGILYLLRGNMKRYWVSVNLPIMMALVFTLVVVVPILDRHKSFVPFCRQVKAIVPADAPLLAYQPDETLRGAIPFYTGRYLIETENLTDIVPFLNKKETIFIVIRDRRQVMEKALLSTGKLHILVRREMGMDRALVLMSNEVPRDMATVGDSFSRAGKGNAPWAGSP